MDPVKGIRSFNEGDFFGAHEAWEGEWRNAGESPEKRFLQGMIMVAAALYHFIKKEAAGTAKLLERAIEVLNANKEAAIAIDKEDFLSAVGAFHEAFKAGQKLSPEDFPKITEKEAPR